MYSAILSFYKHNRAALLSETFRIVENHTNEEAVAIKTTYMSLEEGKAIIGAWKSPYRELFSCMLYGGLGRREALLINTMWPRLKAELAGKGLDKEILTLHFNFRKSQETSFFSFVPASILKPLLDRDMPFTVKGQPMLEWHLNRAWWGARKRAGINGQASTPHVPRPIHYGRGG